MRFSFALAVLLAVLLARASSTCFARPATGSAASPRAGVAGQAPSEALAEDVRRMADVLVQQSVDPRRGYEPLWMACCSAHGTAAPLIAYLATAERDAARAAERQNVRRLLARIQRRAGLPEGALATLERISAAQRTVADEMARAELFDVLDREDEALALYEQLQTRVEDPELRKRILLRCALMGEGLERLAAFAADAAHDVALRNEAAVILALRGEPKAALVSFTPSGEGTERFCQEIRRAEWGIEAEDYAAAQQAAWNAVDEAKLPRDRRYALSVLASAYRRAGATAELLERLEQLEQPSPEARELWIRLLREEGRADAALRLFRSGASSGFDATLRRQLLEICRETGREELLVAAFEDLIRDEPGNLEWRSGLSRYWLEQGERDKALAVWQGLRERERDPQQLLATAWSLQTIGLEDTAIELATQAAQDPAFRARALQFVFEAHRREGRQEQALAVLGELDRPGAGSAILAAVAEGYERLGRPDLAVATLQKLREQLGGFLGSDLEMKLAILLSRVNREPEALEVWRSLWSRLRSTPRGRFVEDRMMTVAARTGTLARIAIELEDRLARGDVEAEGIELLVRLYIKVGDPASATEVVEEFLKRTGSGELELLQRKAKIYLACQDYYHYEQVIEELVERDPEHRLDHLRELAMSQLERGRRDLAIALLPEIRAASGEDSQMADEFEAGVYGLCGMREEALIAYVKGMGRHPERIDTYLLISSLMRETGREIESARMFQYLAQTADQDDLFTIAIDGILNLRAQRNTRVPVSVVRWALRTTFERLAARPGKFYLYRLVADLAAELNDMPVAIRTLKAGLPIAGERRTPILREIMAKARSSDPAARQSFGPAAAFAPSPEWDASEYLMVGRRLLGQGDHVPPQTFMDLSTVFLREGDVAAAMRTFNRAAEVIDYAEVLREAARVLEQADRPKEALRYYQRLLAAGTDDVALLHKIASLEEQLGHETRAFEFHRRAALQILGRTPRYLSHLDEPAANGPVRYFGANVSIEEQLLPQAIDGIVLCASDADAAALIERLEREIAADLATLPEDASEHAERHQLAHYPRLHARAELWRRLALQQGRYAEADAFDRTLLERFAHDRDAAKEILRSRSERGLGRSARELLAVSAFANDASVRLAAGVVDAEATTLSVAGAARLVVPQLAAAPDALRGILERVDTGRLSDEDRAQLGQLLATCVLVGARDAAERFARAGLRNADLRSGIGTLQQTLQLAARVSPELARRLMKDKLQALAESEPMAMLSVVRMLGDLDAALGENTLDSAAAEALLVSLAQNVDRSRPYFYFTSLLGYVDAERRAPLVKEMHAALAPAQRPRLLLDCVHYLGAAPVEPSFEEWYGVSLRVAIEAAGNSAAFRMTLPQTGSEAGQARSPALVLRALDVLEDLGTNPANAAARVGVLIELGRLDEAFACAKQNVPAMLADQQMGRFALQQLLSYLSAAEPKERADEFLHELAKEHPDSDVLRDTRWNLLAASEPETYHAELQAASREAPKDFGLLNRLYRMQLGEGRRVAALGTLERLMELQPENHYLEAQLASVRKQLVHPSRFAPDGEKGEKGEKETEKKATAASGRGRVAATRAVTVQPAFVLVPGGGRIYVDPRAQEILDLHAKGETDAARRAFRRYWRNFAAPNRYVQFPSNLRPGTFLPFEGKLPYLAEELRGVLDVLAGRGSAQIRSEIFDLLVRDMVQRGVVAERRAALQAEVLAGMADTDDAELLLRLLDLEDAGAIDAELLDALVQRPELLDGERLKRLARLCAKCGAPQRGALLHRLAVLSDPSAAARLVADIESVQEVFGARAEPLLLEIVDDLGMSAQGYRFVAWANTAIEVWSRLLAPEAAAERMLALKARIADLAQNSPQVSTRTPRGDVVAATLARAGHYEEALAEVAVWLREEKETPGGVFRVFVAPTQLVKQVVDAEGTWKDRAEWLAELTGAVLAWQQAGELRQAATVLAAMTEALAGASLDELAGRCVETLEAGSPKDAGERVARARALRAVGREDAAFAIEKDLLAAETLPVERIGATARHVQRTEGAEAALRVGEAAARYTWTPELLEVLVECATELGRTEDAASWAERKQRVDALLAKENEAKESAEAARRSGGE